MNVQERIKLVKAMEYICRQINDEEVFMRWLQCGVADGDIEYGDLSDPETDDYLLCYVEDSFEFGELMCEFLHVISYARNHGGLYCDGVVVEEG